MTRLTMLLGALLVLLGIVAYGIALAGEKASVTALIPAFFGVPILGLGLAALRWPARRAVLAHVAVALAVLGLLGSAGRGVPALPGLLSGDEGVNAAAVVVQLVMAALCLAYVALAVRSFIVARRAS